MPGAIPKKGNLIKLLQNRFMETLPDAIGFRIFDLRFYMFNIINR